jgi:hypothetical protein
MAFCVDDLAVGSQLMVGAGAAVALGTGSSKVRGGAYIEGPLQVGKASEFSNIKANLMIGKLNNGDCSSTQYSVWVKGDSKFEENVYVTKLCKANKFESSNGKIDKISGNTLSYGRKNFEIDHPTKPGKRLVYSCLEGPESGVYYRGKLLNTDIIDLPEVWTGLVDEDTITVSVTPIGAHQDIIVKRIGDNKVYLQAKPGIPVHCFFHVFAERKDISKLVTEIDA